MRPLMTGPARTKFEIKILHNELMRTEMRPERNIHFSSKFSKIHEKEELIEETKKEVIFSLYFALATLRTKF